MENTEAAVAVAKGITDYGMMAITAAFFLIIAGVMSVVFVKWFVKLINGIIETQRITMGELLDETKRQNEKLDDIREGLIEETMTRIKVVSSLAFDLSVVEVSRMIKKIREENHISDRANTTEKIRRLVKNLHDDRNSKFDSFTYHGRRLSYYTLENWINEVTTVVIKEVYCDENPERTQTNVSAVYANIKLEFYTNLRTK